jgi:transportin-3
MDALIAKYGSNPAVADRATIALRRGLVFFDEMAFAVAPAVLERLSSAFEQTPASGYLWITGKVVQQFAPRQDAGFDAVVKSAFERESNKVFELLQSTPPAQIPDGELRSSRWRGRTDEGPYLRSSGRLRPPRPSAH